MTVPIPGHLCLPPATSADPPFPLPPRDERGVPAATLPILSGAPGFRRARGGARGGARRANRRVVSRRGRGYSNSDLPAGAIGRNEWARPR